MLDHFISLVHHDNNTHAQSYRTRLFTSTLSYALSFYLYAYQHQRSLLTSLLYAVFLDEPFGTRALKDALESNRDKEAAVNRALKKLEQRDNIESAYQEYVPFSPAGLKKAMLVIPDVFAGRDTVISSVEEAPYPNHNTQSS
ncbi:hypothetical protein O0I10_008427 [Lichtheimia ornata]|uniref:Uncharacterized protein n=1 Tax=Lichtheimia ornata TaxID=688661 RepID=A0AAD7XZK7_9FUNG|nr:uncharacterized protein O0I10_008427 [Lichtheimia ornata]KAJ8655987.1 hypothetical protein O0I10_008427 [Lichtheimia ornata]